MTTETKPGSVLTENAPQDGAGAAPPAAPAAPAPAETPEQKAAAAEKAALEAAVDEKWAPKLPDGTKLDDATLKDFRELAAKGGLKAGQAQALIEYDLKRQAAAEKASNEAFMKQRETWRASLKSDPDFGGPKYEANLRNVQRAMAKFGGSEAFKKFADAGVGDHPEFVKFVAAVGAALGEDPGTKQPARPAAAGSGDAQLRNLFPKSPELFSA